MNKRQKYTLLSFSILTVLLISAWFFLGGRIFTVTQVLIEKKDELFGWTEKRWIDKFVPGLDLTLGIICATAVITVILYYRFRNSKDRIDS
jgi:hypothetical protein